MNELRGVNKNIIEPNNDVRSNLILQAVAGLLHNGVSMNFFS